MNTNKAAYWIALGVLALGLNSEYRQGNFVAVHRVADRAGVVLCQIATRAERTLAVARVLANREALPTDDLFAVSDRAEMAREQAEMLREQAQDRAELLRDRVLAHADVMRAQAEARRAEIAQMRARSGFRFTSTADRRVMVVCPKTGARVAVDAGPDSIDVSPDIEIDDNF